MGFSFRMGTSTIATIVKETCTAIWKVFVPIHMPPLNADLCKKTANEFHMKWNFPNCFGAIDGKHVRIICPRQSGSNFYNYKHFFSIVLQGVADSNCRFLAIDVGARGKQSDGGVFRESDLYHCLMNDLFCLPSGQNLPNSDDFLPFVLLGDEAYPLLPFLMRPFPRSNLSNEKVIFNYRLSRARRCIECAFGIMSQKFRLLDKTIETSPDTADIVIKSICILHNVVIDKEGLSDLGDSRRNDFGERSDAVVAANERHSSRYAANVRNKFVDFFNSTNGAVAWQYDVTGINI